MYVEWEILFSNTCTATQSRTVSRACICASVNWREVSLVTFVRFINCQIKILAKPSRYTVCSYTYTHCQKVEAHVLLSERSHSIS